jgi:hypothetical protein
MRRTIWLTALAWSAGFCMAAALASATTMLNAWRGYGEYFQLGYVVGYLDAVRLQHLRDRRVNLPSTGTADFERWRGLVNEYFADPKNANRAVPDAMFAAGQVITEEIKKTMREQMNASPSPSTPSPSP